jgi:2-oxoglutarate ferredoxin oxidoreductase subunit beta
MTLVKLTRKDFVSDQEVRWCPGCADYSVLAQVQRTLPTLGIPRENFVFVSGIGCSSRFPYYMNTYGIHSIHGRAPAIATGLKLARPDLSVWVVTGDGDGFAIGTSHVVHAIRRNVDLKILLFNNRIYGLTKGQCSPTSEFGKKTKSTPLGSVDYPLNPVRLALGAGATFVARTIATETQQVQGIIDRAARHKGTAFIEILQNCVIFNDGAFDPLEDKTRRLFVQHGKPLVFGGEPAKGIALDGVRPVIVDAEHAMVYDETSELMALMLAHLDPAIMPPAFGVLRSVERPAYDTLVHEQMVAHRPAGGLRTVQALLEQGDTWTVGEGAKAGS